MISLGISHFIRCWTTGQWERWWKKRCIDWEKEYLVTWNHPHRQMIVASLVNLDWFSLFEIGCGAGANIVAILKRFPDRQLGGSDINEDAIELAKKTFSGGMFEVCPNDNIMGSDNFTDIILADRTLMYTSWFKINKTIKEIRRSCRIGVLIVEYHTDSWWDKLKLFLSSGLYAHDYELLLRKAGFYDIAKIDMPPMKNSDKAQQKLLTLIYAKK